MNHKIMKTFEIKQIIFLKDKNKNLNEKCCDPSNTENKNPNEKCCEPSRMGIRM